ncbi:MAG: hypothetical protein ABR581_04705 [Thermoleophilaceae bacterium]
MAAPVSAHAATPASQFDQPALGQYIETLPGSGGPSAPGVGGGPHGPGAPLSGQALAGLRREGGSLASPLRQLATSRQYGAPPAGGSHQGQAIASRAGDDRSLASALADTVAPKGGSGGTLWLLLALLAVTAAAAGLAVRNRHLDRRATG